MFDKGEAFGHNSIIEDGNLSSSSFKSIEEALFGFHKFVKGRKARVFTGGNGESSFTEDLPGPGVLFYFSFFIRFSGLVHIGRKSSPGREVFFSHPVFLKIGTSFSDEIDVVIGEGSEGRDIAIFDTDEN